MPPNDAMPGGPMAPGFFQPFMSPRYPGGPRPALRMPNQPGGIPGSQPLLPNSLDPTRPQGEADDFTFFSADWKAEGIFPSFLHVSIYSIWL
ncbi:Single-stranded DNA-binding protein 3 [Characodon lateralis]|uniref:Single-stranded DNA-binding protein 3 n=1 Tax=Characodon lateralis TaxID=208331 RepID=A0ABU7D3S2_9TELE|nr:Single-stranded DNA-binding protein 3 [Characodon lateralis]